MITRDMLPSDMVETIKSKPVSSGDGWWRWPNIQDAFKIIARERIANPPAYPIDRFKDRGIVICAGGSRLFTCGYVCANMLRHHGCSLPIEFWHFDHEIDHHMKELVKPLDVECVNVRPFQDEYKPRVLHGWELKPFAIIHSKFKEVMLLDADNVPVKDPSFLFDCEAYRETGAIFWPDYGKLARSREIWSIFETKYDDYANQHEFESGQILVNKERHWQALDLAMFMNEYSDYYYKFIHGDKCTFEMAWKRLKQPFHLVKKTIHPLDATMCQHSPIDGSRVFQHRNLDKWTIENRNRRINDFWLEDECRAFIRELQGKWSGQPFKAKETEVTLPDSEVQETARTLANRTFVYHRVGFDKREIELLSDGKIGTGADRCEQHWEVHRNSNDVLLTISGTTPTCHLRKIEGIWRGYWIHHEKMPIELYLPKQQLSLL
jgi:hypothetical protein